jgi:UDP-N-acetylmuramoyl-tripeptide--D-alanyl-D-alanine ligase
VSEVLEIVPGRLADGDVILVKGSNSVGLSKLIEKLAMSEVA